MNILKGLQGSINHKWKQSIDKDMGPRGFPDILASDIFKDWDRDVMPELAAEIQFECALDIACAYPDHKMIRPFLERSLTIAKRALAEKPLATDPTMSNRFPGNRGHLLRIKSYASGLLDKGALDIASLKQASEDLIGDKVLSEWEPAEWEDLHQTQYLVAVQLALVCGDVSRASDLLKVGCKFEDVKGWHEGLDSLLAVIQKSAEGRPQAITMPKEWKAHFDSLRDPTQRIKGIVGSRPILRLETSLITHLYAHDTDGSRATPDWLEVITYISR